MTATPTRDPPEELSLRAHRRIVGTIGFFLPALVYGFAAARPTAGLDRWQLLWSVSAYYYTGAVGVFVGALFALSLFLFSYRGYKGVIADRIVGGVGGLAALVVALFPTAAPGRSARADLVGRYDGRHPLRRGGGAVPLVHRVCRLAVPPVGHSEAARPPARQALPRRRLPGMRAGHDRVP